MRKLMTKEVTTTTLKLAKMQMVEGQPVATALEDEILLGNVSLEKAQQFATKKHGAGVTVFEAVADTKVYELSVEDFIKHASVKEEQIEATL
jgi:Histone-like Protein p6